MAPLDLFADDALVTSAAAFAKQHMSNYDASHDWNHILRVVSLAHTIHAATYPDEATLSSPPSSALRKITLSALLHDVGDRKYLAPGQDGATLVSDFLLGTGHCTPELATEVQAICLGVSYSSEIKDPPRVAALIQKYPELAAVQDADRIDAIGAVGVGRCFTFGALKGGAAQQGNRDLQNSVDHFEEKLFRIEGLMKTDKGREIAGERTERLRIFEKWWNEENTASEG